MLAARVSAIVKSVHMSALKPKFIKKKKARSKKATPLLWSERCRAIEMCEAQDDVRAVVVSLAKTPLKAAQAPEAAAMGSHVGVLEILAERLLLE